MVDQGAPAADNPPARTLHPVYSVTNIQNKVRILDGDKVTYSDWVKLFRLHAHGYDVLNHIDGSGPPAKTDPSYEAWSKIDAIVLQWIYGTLSDSYLKRVIDTDCTAQQAWDRLHTVFLNNKNARAATLEHAFTTTTMASCSSLNAYFQQMKDLAEQLNDVDHPVSDSRLVLQMVTGLPQEYDTVASFIIQADKSWDDAREMIEREQRRQAARQAALTAHTPQPSNPTNNPWQPTWSRPNTTAPQQPPQHPNPPPGFGLTAPSPYPPSQYPYPPTYPPSQPVDPMQPTELGAALSALTINQPMPQWNMDTGASSHITSDQGSQDWTTSFAP
ncbi:hypothetical protein HanLR1_Chr06g0208461 [Helianthus annuus]|nr:hypothetical protein HanLR1_Chr06g0208461 [Helianthus annuus]